ncbi:MAG TPA: NAD(P)H-hydrate epimerase, partial [Candidatus Eisenbacteria bacterium]|nr:NAD(P)H-hydrate epimerase [Candidatus Eisenbacteria bacterium]
MRLPPLESRAVTAEQMAALDRATIQGRGIPSLALMERAGREAAKRIAAWWRSEGGTLYGTASRAAGGTQVAGAPARGKAGARKPAARRAPAGGNALILCGRGNNGGDGFVAAR